jgi:streptogramin lyase
VTTLDFRPSGILFVGDEIWAEDHAQTGKFYAIEPDTGEVLAAIPARRPCDLAFGDDRLWLVDLGAGSVIVVDPATRQVVDTIGGDFEDACGPQVAGGAVWFAANPGFARLDPKSGTFAITETGDGTFPAAGVTPTGKSIWGVVYSTAELVKIAIRTGKVQLRISPPGGVTEEEPAIVAFESLWIGNAAAHRVHRADAETGKVTAEIETLPPSRFVATDDGLWYSSYLWGAVGRIDPATNKVVFSATLGGNINGLTAGRDAIWAVDTKSGKLYRIDQDASGIYD